MMKVFKIEFSTSLPGNGEKMSKTKGSESKFAAPIVIDPQAGLKFDSEAQLLSHFNKEIEVLENEFFDHRSKTDINKSQLGLYDGSLSELLDNPDEIWEDSETFPNDYVWFYLKNFGFDKKLGVDRYHLAACYLSGEVPSFVYLHFPTTDKKLVKRFCRQEKIFDKESYEAPLGAIDGDALNEGDELADGLYKAMMLLRGDADVEEGQFVEFHELREPSIEEPDEIWRNTDSFGNTLVSFIREYPDFEEKLIWYIVVTLEDGPSNSHALMFSFPTRDESLVERYRHGENLQAEEVVQESSH